jgi:hypothetical protein
MYLLLYYFEIIPQETQRQENHLYKMCFETKLST